MQPVSRKRKIGKTDKILDKLKMISIILTMLAGVGLGYLLKNVRLMRKCGTAVSVVIWIMLFSLGLKIGADKELIGNLSGIGLQALVLAVFGVAGSVIAATIVYKVFFKERQTDSE